MAGKKSSSQKIGRDAKTGKFIHWPCSADQ